MTIRIEPKPVEAFCIYGAHALDPITVMLQDFGTGSGRLVIECYGEAWAAYWGAMGEDRIHEFVIRASPDYLVSKLKGSHQSNASNFRDYTYRVVIAVQQALQSRTASALETAAAPSDPGRPVRPHRSGGGTSPSLSPLYNLKPRPCGCVGHNFCAQCY